MSTTQIKTPATGKVNAEDFAVTRNACKLCTPLGASLAFKGIAGALNILHGSQGCATYIRRYMISHFREPIDIASSNFTEHSTVFGGKSNLHTALDNLVSQYDPALIGVATTCLAETIGEDLPGMLQSWIEYRKEKGQAVPAIVGVNTPSYIGTHREGFQATVRQVAASLAQSGPTVQGRVNILPGMASPEDLRWIKRTCAAFGLEAVILPDYSETLDGGLWADYQAIPAGGTSIDAIRSMGSAQASIELGALPLPGGSAGSVLQEKFGVPLHALDLPIGMAATDRFLAALARISGKPVPDEILGERQRLADSYVDAHKYVAGLRTAVFGEEDLVVGLAALCAEMGAKPVLCSSGGKSGLMKARLPEVLAWYGVDKDTSIAEGIDFITMENQARDAGVQLALGSSKGYKLSLKLDIPLVRAGFPIHDRFGGGRIPHYGYPGSQHFHDLLVNAVLEHRQSSSEIGYTYF